MVKIKVIKAAWEAEEELVGNIYEAFEMKHPDGRMDYCTHTHPGSLTCIQPENCEVVEDEVSNTLATEEQKHVANSTSQILMVEDGSVNENELAEWCENNGIKLIVYRHGANKPEFLK